MQLCWVLYKCDGEKSHFTLKCSLKSENRLWPKVPVIISTQAKWFCLNWVSFKSISFYIAVPNSSQILQVLWGDEVCCLPCWREHELSCKQKLFKGSDTTNTLFAAEQANTLLLEVKRVKHLRLLRFLVLGKPASSWVLLHLLLSFGSKQTFFFLSPCISSRHKQTCLEEKCQCLLTRLTFITAIFWFTMIANYFCWLMG